MTDKILIVDDEPDISTLLKRYFEKTGYDVSTAIDGREAVEIAAKVNPDLVLLDIQLPVLDGFEVLEEFKKRGVETRVVMFSGYFKDRDTAIRCIRNGACDFITKPVDIKELSNKIKKYILVEKTINLQIADTTPVVDKLIGRTEYLETEVDRLEAENACLRKKDFRKEVISKAIYIALSVISVYSLSKTNVLEGGISVGLIFVLLFLFLMIPMDRIQRVSAQISKLKTQITMKSEGTPTKSSSRRRKPRG
ncbi:MAG: response regulator [Candidatus Zhuqueibacterota bacterium]